MYATNLTDQLFSAALPLKPLVCWCGSAESVTVAVPPAAALAGLNIGSVGVTLSLPDGSNVAAQAVHVANTPLWTATFPAANFATSGTVAQGLMVTLAGEDENGVVRTWIVAKGDLEVRPGDASPSPGGSWVAVKLRDSAPDNPVEGDAYVSDGELHIFAGGEWVVIGGGHDAAKLDGAAAYPAWNAGVAAYLKGSVVSWHGRLWRAKDDILDLVGPPDGDGAAYWEEKTIAELKQDSLSSAQMAAVNSGATAAKVTAWDGYAAQIAQKASLSDLPYALVTPGEWTFSGVPSGVTVSVFEFDGSGNWYLSLSDGDYGFLIGTDENILSAEILTENGVTVTATRASLPGHLCDRAVNAVAVSTDTTLTLPALVNAGKARDFLVRLAISGSTVPTITFAAPTGETIAYETDGDEFPVLDAEGTWLYSFTETAAGVFAVALKSVSVVTQGGV